MKPRKAAIEIAKKIPRLILSIIMVVGVVVVSSILGFFSQEVMNINTVEGYTRIVVVSALLITALIFMLKIAADVEYILDTIFVVFEFHLPGLKEDDPLLKRILKNITYVVILILAVAFFTPILSQIPVFGRISIEFFTLISLSISLLLIYDIARTYEKVTEKNAKFLTSVIEKILDSVKKVRK